MILANAHFIDSDITGTSGSDSWTSTGKEYIASEPKLVYFAENSKVWGVLFNFEARKALTINTGGTAIDNGDGTVAIPFNNHPFMDGQTVQLSTPNHANYNGDKTVSAITPNTFSITATFQAGTFDGTETAVLRISINSGLGRMDYDSNGNMYIGETLSGGNCIVVVDKNGSKSAGIFVPDGGWHANTGAVRGIRVSSDDLYLYVLTSLPRVYKFNISDGSEIWNVTPGLFSTTGYNIDLDSNDNVYVCGIRIQPSQGATYVGLVKYATADGGATAINDSKGRPMAGVYDVYIDTSMSYSSNSGVVITGGYMIGGDSLPYTLYNLAIRDLDDADGTETALGGTYVSGSTRTGIIGSYQITTYDNYIYVMVYHTVTFVRTIYKLDTNLVTIASVIAPSNADSMFFDQLGQLVVVNQDSTTGDDLFYFYDTNLTYLSNTIADYSVEVLASLNNSFIKCRPSFIYGQSPWTETTFSYPNTQNRTTAMPTDYSHLNGQTVQILEDGEVSADQVVTNGAVTTTGTVNHIGLKFISTIKPTKIDLFRLGLILTKKITKAIINFYQTVMGKVGVDSNMETISFGSTLFSGLKEVPLADGYDRDGDIIIQQDEPLPMITRGLELELGAHKL